MSELKSLADHNSAALAAYEKAKEPRGNGIACPECGQELFDNGISYSIEPPQYVVYCLSCGWEGSRL